MKRENLEEAKKIIKRLNTMEIALQIYDRSKDTGYGWRRLFVSLFKNKKKADLEVGYSADETISISEEQQKELADLMRKWIRDDKEKVESL
jgi:transcriptional regulator